MGSGRGRAVVTWVKDDGSSQTRRQGRGGGLRFDVVFRRTAPVTVGRVLTSSLS